MIAERLLKEIRERLRFLVDVGLDYLTLDRPAGTLAGGEAQRIRLATQIGCGLVGVLYILDEPSIGLHQRDNRRLIDTLIRLRDLGNTLIVVEHDEATIMRGRPHRRHRPAARGSTAARSSTRATSRDCSSANGRSPARSSSGRRQIPTPERPPQAHQATAAHRRASREHNLKNVTVDIPLGTFVCVTGVSAAAASPPWSRTSCSAR